MNSKSIVRALVGTIGAVALVVLPAAVAQADSANARAVAVTQKFMKNKTKVSSDYTNKSNRIGSCKVANTGATCSVGTLSSATRTVSLSLGATRSWASGQLGFSSASTVTSTTTCTSPSMKAGSTWNAYPRGARWSYKIQSITTVNNIIAMNQTSGTLYAFDPKKNSIACSLG